MHRPPAQRRSKPRPRAGFRPLLEQLEGRLPPGNILALLTGPGRDADYPPLR